MPFKTIKCPTCTKGKNRDGVGYVWITCRYCNGWGSLKGGKTCNICAGTRKEIDTCPACKGQGEYEVFVKDASSIDTSPKQGSSDISYHCSNCDRDIKTATDHSVTCIHHPDNYGTI